MREVRDSQVLGCCLVLALILITAVVAVAQVPRKINYQGRIIDSATGEPLPGNHDITFRIYDSVSDGYMLWSEQQPVSADSAGVVSVVLGSSTPIDITFEAACWLEVEVDGEVLLPRREIVSVPYAFHALNSDSLGGLGSAAFSLTGHSHDDAYVNEGEDSSVTAAMLLPDVVSSIDGVRNDGGDIDLVAGSNITITPDDANDRITIEATGSAGGDITAVYADDGLSGGATTGDAHLSVNTGTGLEVGGDTVGLTSDYSTGSAYDSRFVNETQTSSVTVEMVVPDILSSLDGVRNDGGNIDLAPGSNITITPDDGNNRITIATTAAGDGHSLDAADGTPADVVYVDTEGEVGIGTNSAAAKLDVRGTLNVGTNGTGHDVNFYAYETDSRMFWNESKRALRSGDDPDDYWSDANTGYYSTALGRYVMASGSGSFATGLYQEASGWNSIAMGEYSDALGRASVALGSNTYAGEDYSVAIGNHAGTTHGDAAIGTYVIASAGSSFVMGRGAGFNDPLINTIPNSLMVGFGSTEPALFVGGINNYVGIGTDDPQVPLDTPGPMRIGEWIGIPGYGTGLMIIADDNTSTTIPLQIRNQAGDDLVFVRGDGGVGIGEVLPVTRCHIREEDIGLESDVLQFEDVVVEDLDAVMGLYSGDAGNAGSAISFAEISGGDLADKWGIIRETTRGGSGGGSGLRFTFGTGSDHFTNPMVMYLDDTGKVGIGTKSFGAELFRVNGSACATAWDTCSDLKFKENIANVENALEKVLKLRGVRFTWRREDYEDRNFPEGVHYGVIAQEAEEVLPEIVKDGPDGEKSVAYSEIIPVLIESVRELKAENETLKERVAALEVGRD